MVDEVEEFIALGGSVLNDGDVTEEHAYQLGDWLNHHEAAAGHWPCNQLIEPLQAVWADGTADPQKLESLGRVLLRLQEEWALRKGAMATYYKSLGPAAALPGLPHATRPLPPPPPAPPSKGRRWILAAGSAAVVVVAAGLFAVREINSAHDGPVASALSPIVRATAAPSAPSASAAPPSAPVHSFAKPAIPSAAWTVITRQNVKTKVGKKEFVIPKGTTLKVIARASSDLMVSYKGESLTIPASATTNSTR